jgi:proline iminopeptidase
MFASNDTDLRTKAINAWANFESSCSVLRPEPSAGSSHYDDQHRTSLAILEAHYFKYNLFTPDSLLLDNAHKLYNIPGVIVQGRYDVICPIITANELHHAWPKADYRIIADAGHSALEPGIRTALVEATERFKTIRSF